MPDTYIAQYANVFLNATLQRGFTTIRDIGGGDVGISRAIDHGLVRGPRFYYAGKIMSQTGGHGDMRPGWEVVPSEQLCSCGIYSTNLACLVDNPYEMRKAVRDELRKASHCIKLMGSGGVVSPNDPLHHTQFTEEEIRAPVRTGRLHPADTAPGVAKSDEVLAEELYAQGRTVRLGQLAREQRGHPVGAEDVAHGRAGARLRERCVFLRR